MMQPPTTDVESRKKIRLLLAESIDKRQSENDARRKASQSEPDNPLMCDLLSIMNHLIKGVGKLGAEIRKNKGDS